MLRWPDPLPRDARAQLMRVRIASQTKTYIRACVSLHARMRHAYICICPCDSSMRLMGAIVGCDFVLRLQDAIIECDSEPRLLAAIVGCDCWLRFMSAIRTRDYQLRFMSAIVGCDCWLRFASARFASAIRTCDPCDYKTRFRHAINCCDYLHKKPTTTTPHAHLPPPTCSSTLPLTPTLSTTNRTLP